MILITSTIIRELRFIKPDHIIHKRALFETHLLNIWNKSFMVKFCLHVITWFYMLLHVISCYYMLLHVFTCYCMLLYVISYYSMLVLVNTCYSMLLHVTACYYMLVHVSTCYCMLLHVITCYYRLLYVFTDCFCWAGDDDLLTADQDRLLSGASQAWSSNVSPWVQNGQVTSDLRF